MFSFGVVAYELLAGKLPYTAPPILDKLAGRAPPAFTPLAQRNPELPAKLCVLVDKCLAESPETRSTAQIIATAIAEIAELATLSR